MEITVQDIKNMFDNNYRAFLGEDRMSDIAGILYNSPTARNNLQQMKNYNDRKGISSNGTIILTNNAVIPTARATEGPGGVGIVVIDLLRKCPEDLQSPNEIQKPHPKKR